MTIRYQCTECESVLKIREGKAGQAGRCPKCKTAFVIPEPELDEDRRPLTPPAAAGSGDAEDDAMAFLMESGDVPAAAPLATTSLEGEDELAPAIPPAPPSPSERQLHRPPTRPQADSDDTSSAASDLLTRSEAARVAAGNEKPVDSGPLIDMDEVREVAKRRVLPIVGGFLLVAGICYLMVNSMASDPDVPPLAPVSGTVTLDGKPLPQATVNFEPITDRTDPDQSRLGGSVGRSDTDGIYTLTYPGGHEGAVLGNHTVRVNKTDANGLEVLGKKYHLESQLKHFVKVGANTIDLVLKSEPGGRRPIVDPLADPRVNPSTR